MKSVMVTGSSGLIGPECVSDFRRLVWRIRVPLEEIFEQLAAPARANAAAIRA